jgi:hypothetical protein
MESQSSLKPDSSSSGRRILILGEPATGKTTLARLLSARLGLPLLLVDEVERGTERPLSPDDFSIHARDFLARHPDGWVCDGYGTPGSGVLAAYDTVIELRPGLGVTTWRALTRRIRMLRGGEPLSASFGRRSFLYWMLTKRGAYQRRIRRLTESRTDGRRHIVLAGKREVEAFLRELPEAP